ncbi:MAG: hypothetical protein ABI758_05145 [Candidatus Woesebacteria bacterium]
MTESDKKLKVLEGIGLSTSRAQEVLNDESDTFWDGIASGSIVLSPDQLLALFSKETEVAA